jgi:hypothetical protein
MLPWRFISFLRKLNSVKINFWSLANLLPQNTQISWLNSIWWRKKGIFRNFGFHHLNLTKTNAWENNSSIIFSLSVPKCLILSVILVIMSVRGDLCSERYFTLSKQYSFVTIVVLVPIMRSQNQTVRFYHIVQLISLQAIREKRCSILLP